MTELEGLDQLATLTVSELATWLRDCTLDWANATDQPSRLGAFRPATLLADDPDQAAGAALADELLAAFRGRSANPSEAVALAIEGWSLVHDGATGAALLIQLATELAAPRLAAALESILNKPGAASVAPHARLGSVLSTAACERLSRAAAEQVAADARRAGLMSADDAARVLSYVCKGQPARIVEVVSRLRIYEGGSYSARAVAALLRECTDAQTRHLLSVRDAAHPEAHNWLEGVVAVHTPRLPSRRSWRLRAPKAPSSLIDTIAEIEEWLGKKYPREIQSTRKGLTLSTFDSKEDMDPSEDPTSVASVYNIESAHVRRR